MLKGAKKAIIRAPHRLLGSKSIEDKVVVEWTKDFITAEEAISQIIRETKSYTENWRDICKAQEELALTFRELYEPIREENMYKPVQETPESSLTAVAQYREFVGGRGSSTDGRHGNSVDGGLLEAIDPYLSYLEGPFTVKLEESKKCLKGVQKLLTKREHKKVDFDRHSNSLEKLQKKRHSGGEALNEKELQAISKQEQELNQAAEIFQEIDEKVKSTVPYVLTYMSEFLNLVTASLYLSQFKIFEASERLLAQFSQEQGLSGDLSIVPDLPTEFPAQSSTLIVNGEPSDYINIMDGWEERYTLIQPRYEQGLTTIRDGETVKKPIGESRVTRKELAAKRIQEATLKTLNKGLDATSGLAHKAIGKIPRHYVENIQFSSPEHGFFRTEADLLQAAAINGPLISLPLYDEAAATNEAAVSPSSTAGLGSFSFFRRSSSVTQQSLSRSSSSSQVKPPIIPSKIHHQHSGFYGRSPVTSSFKSVEADNESRAVLRTRVRASMSTAAWSLNENEDTMDSISNRLRGASISGDMNKAHVKLDDDNDQLVKTQRIIAPAHQKAVALFTFNGEEAGDVAFRAGEEVEVLDHGDETDQNWWLGKTGDGRVGLFPKSFVKIL